MKRRGLFVTGTDTGVGKTRVAAGMAAALKRMAAADEPAIGEVRVWKPVQTGVASPEADDADSRRLKGEGGLEQSAADIATLTFPDPLAPWMAARRRGESIDYAALLAEGERRMAQSGFLLVEGAGGLAVPLTRDKLIAHLAADLGLPLLIVARCELGTVNHTLCTVWAARRFGIRVAGVVFNGFTASGLAALDEHAEMIAAFADVPIVGRLPWLGEGAGESPPEGTEDWTARWAEIVRTSLDWSVLLQS
jgi:dethiobiotin synthetase